MATNESVVPAVLDQPTATTLPVNRRLVVIQRNPTSGSGRGTKQLLVLIRELRKLGFRVRLFADRSRLDKFLAQPQVGPLVRCLVAAGGDGTVGSLVNRHSKFPIATLPLGTENLLARYLQIPRCGNTLAGLIKSGRTRAFDIGTVNGEQFLLMLSVGIDAEVVRRLHAGRTGNIQHISYLKPIIRSFMSYSFPTLSVHAADGQLLAEGTHVIATNIPEYGFRFPFSPEANPNDGLLDVRILKVKGRLATILHAVRTRLGWKHRKSEIVRFNAKEFEIRSSGGNTPTQFDGDPGPNCPVRARICPAAMTLVVAE